LDPLPPNLASSPTCGAGHACELEEPQEGRAVLSRKGGHRKGDLGAEDGVWRHRHAAILFRAAVAGEERQCLKWLHKWVAAVAVGVPQPAWELHCRGWMRLELGGVLTCDLLSTYFPPLIGFSFSRPLLSKPPALRQQLQLQPGRRGVLLLLAVLRLASREAAATRPAHTTCSRFPYEVGNEGEGKELGSAGSQPGDMLQRSPLGCTIHSAAVLQEDLRLGLRGCKDKADVRRGQAGEQAQVGA